MPTLFTDIERHYESVSWPIGLNDQPAARYFIYKEFETTIPVHTCGCISYSADRILLSSALHLWSSGS